MEEKELLAAWEKIQSMYGPQKKTFDEFKFQMQSNEYRSKVFKNVGQNAKDIFGYADYQQFNADKFLPAPAKEITNTPESAENLPRFQGSSASFVDQQVEAKRNQSNYNADGSAGRMPTLYDRMSEQEKKDLDLKNKKAKQFKQAERGKKGLGTTSQIVSDGGDFYEVIRNYSLTTGENLLASQLDYNEGKLDGVAKGQFEQKAINLISEDMFQVVDETEKSQVWENYGEEYGFLINQLNSQGKEIRGLQDQLATAVDPQRRELIIEQINNIREEGAEYSYEKPNQYGGTDAKRFLFTDYDEMQKRFSKLNSLPEFKNYQRAINVLGHLRDVSDNFDTRNPEFVQNQKDLKSAQEFVDIKEKYDLPELGMPGTRPPKWFNNNITKPILSSLAKAVNDAASLPRTLAFNDEYGWTDALAEGAERILTKELNPNMVASLGQASNKDRGLSERVAMVDDYQLVVSDDLFEGRRTPKTVRDKDGFLIQDEKIVKEVIDKYEEDPTKYEDEQQYNFEGALPKFVGVMADLGILMFGTKGLGTGVKATGTLAKAGGLTRTGNYLSKSNVANRIGLTGAVTGQTHNQLYTEAIKQGLSPSEASAFAVTGSLAVATIAQFNPQFYLIGEKKAAQALTSRYINYLAAGGKESKKKAFGYAMREVFGQGKREAFEELAEIPALNAVRGGFNEFLTPEKQFEVNWSRGEIEESAIFGFAAGFSTGPMNITSQSALQQQATYAAYKAKDKFFKRTDELVGKEYMDPETGNMLNYTQEQADATKTKFSNLFKQLDAAKGNTKYSEEVETKLLSLLQRSEAIKQNRDLALGNPALLEVLDAQYAIVNDAIAKVLQDNRTPVKPEKYEREKATDSKGNRLDAEGNIMSSEATPEVNEEVDSAIDEALNNDSENVLDGRVKPEAKPEEDVELEVNENTTEQEIENIANEGSKQGRKQQAKNIGAKVEGDQKVESEINPETKTEPPVDTKTTSKTGAVIEPGVVKIESQKQFEALENALRNEDITDEELEQLGFKREPYYDPGNDMQRTHKNLKIDITSTPVFEEINLKGKPTGKKYHRLFNSTQKGVGYYVPVGKEIYLDDRGTTRPTDVEGNKMGDGTYMSDSMFAQPEGTQTSTETNPEPKKPLFTKDELSTAKADQNYLDPLIKRLKENFPGVNIEMDAEAVEQLALSQGVSPEMAKKARGVYDATNNRVLINPKTAGKDTPIHEFAHVWTRIAKDERPELWKKGMELMKDSPIYKKLKEQIAQNPDLQKVYTEDKILDEALAVAIGQRGAKIFEDQQQETMWKNWIQEFFDFIKDKFNVQSEGDIQNLTLREFIELASTEILTGDKVVPARQKLETLNKNIEVKYNKEGDLEIINKKTGKPVSKPTRRKVEQEIIKMNELPAEWVDAGTTLYEALQEDKNNREGFYDPVESAFIGYKVKRQSFIDNSDVNNITNTLARGWLSNKKGQGLDVIAMEIEGMVYGGEYNASQPRVEVQDLVDIMLKNPGNYLAVPEQVKDAKDNFMEVTGMYPTMKNAEAIKDKISDSNSKLDEVYDEDFLDQDIQNDEGELPFQLSFQANFVDPMTGLSYSYDKNSDTFKALEAAGFITKNKTLRDFSDKNMVLHTPDFAFSGSISKDGDLIVEGKGGMYYPIKFHQAGFFWASTEDGASSLVRSLNQSLAKNKDGKVYMGLVTATPSKLLSSTTAANGVVDVFMSPTFLKGLGMTESQVTRSLVNAANFSTTKNVKDNKGNIKQVTTGLRAGVSAKANIEDTLKLIRTKLASDKSSFEDRKVFVESFLGRVAKRINPKSLDPKTGKMKFVNSKKSIATNKKIVKFFKESIGFTQMKATGGRVSPANLKAAVSYMLGEPLLRSESQTNKIYAVLEIDGKVKPVKSDAHESYPKAIASEGDARTKLHILKDRMDWRDNVADPDTDTNIEVGRPRNKDGKPRSHIQILPTTVGLSYAPVRVLNQSENPGMSFQLNTDTNKKQISESITRLKEQGKFTEQQLVDYYHRRFPDVSKKELGEMYNGKVPEDSPRSEKRKYTNRLEEVLSEQTFEELSEEAKTYIPKRNNITEAEADAMFEGLGLEDAIVVVKSNPEYLLPEVRIALTNKVVMELEKKAQQLRAEGKDSEANLISASINSIVEVIAAEGTKAGRFIQAFKLLKALSADRTVSLVNKKLKEAGKQPLTKEQEAELKRLKQESDNAAEGLPKSEAMAKQFKYIQKLLGSSFKGVFEAYFYASILSGMTTQLRNIMANVMSIGNELIVTSIREAILGNPKAIFQAPMGMIKGLSKGWLNAKNILQTGIKSDKSNKFDNPALLEWWRFNTNETVIGKLLPKKVTDSADWLLNSKFLPWSPNFLKYVQRAMVAGDQMFFHSAKEMQARALANRIKRGKDVTPEDVKRAESILEPSQELKDQAKAQAIKEGFKEGTTRYKIRVHELIEAQRDMTIQGQSEDFAAKTTFNYEPEGALSYLYNFIVQSRQMPGIGPIMTTFIPFARVLTNVFNRFLHYTPVGAVTAYRGKVRIASGKIRTLSTEEKADLYIKSSIGLSTMAGLVAYLMSQADDDDAVLKISAAGPSDFNKKYELQKAGWKPFTITVGDVSVSYQDHPLYFILAGAGTLYESDKYGNSIDGEGNADLFSYVALTTAMSMLQQSWLQGLSDLGRILNSNDPAKAIANKTFGVLGSVAMPNFHKQLVRQYMEIMSDPIKARRTGTLSGAIDQLYRDIPIANSGLYDMVDNFGDPVIPNQGEKFVPLSLDFGERGDPLVKHLVEEGVFVGSARNRKIEDFETGESRYLDGDEYQVYKMESAKAVGKLLRENYSYLKTLKGEELGETVKMYKQQAREETLYELFYYDKYKELTKKK